MQPPNAPIHHGPVWPGVLSLVLSVIIFLGASAWMFVVSHGAEGCSECAECALFLLGSRQGGAVASTTSRGWQQTADSREMHPRGPSLYGGGAMGASMSSMSGPGAPGAPQPSGPSARQAAQAETFNALSALASKQQAKKTAPEVSSSGGASLLANEVPPAGHHDGLPGMAPIPPVDTVLPPLPPAPKDDAQDV